MFLPLTTAKKFELQLLAHSINPTKKRLCNLQLVQPFDIVTETEKNIIRNKTQAQCPSQSVDRFLIGILLTIFKST